MNSANRAMFRVTKPALILAQLLSALMLRAQQQPDPVAAAGGCALCSSILMIPVVLFVLNIALLVWVARDAKARAHGLPCAAPGRSLRRAR